MAPQLISENLDVLTGTKSLLGSVSLTTSHVYEFNLKFSSSFNLTLTNLDGNADVKLIKGTTTLNQSSNGDRLAESINQVLDPSYSLLRSAHLRVAWLTIACRSRLSLVDSQSEIEG